MAASNPNPAVISAPIWRLWTEFDAFEPTVVLSGIVAEKPGYHSWRSRLPSTDYSTGRDVANDRLGPGDKASAIDLTMSTAAMIRYTSRLDVAARARDPRLYTPAGPVLREFIGTKDGTTVYCYVLVGGVPLGVGADSGPDPGRDKSHLWHLHSSIIRRFIDDAAAIDGVLSVLKGESLASWRARTEGDNVGVFEEVWRTDELKNPYGDSSTGNPKIWGETALFNIGGATDRTEKLLIVFRAETAARDEADRVRDEATAAAIKGLSDAISRLSSGASVEATPIINAVYEVRDEARAKLDQLHGQIAEANVQLVEANTRLAEADAEIERLRAALAAGAQATVDSLSTATA